MFTHFFHVCVVFYAQCHRTEHTWVRSCSKLDLTFQNDVICMVAYTKLRNWSL